MICTSYFANWRNLKNMKLISISRYAPHWLNVNGIALELAPPSDLLRRYRNGQINQDQYTLIYTDTVLKHLQPRAIYDRYNGCVLLCYEKTGNFCHRRIVASWLENAIGEEVPEI